MIAFPTGSKLIVGCVVKGHFQYFWPWIGNSCTA